MNTTLDVDGMKIVVEERKKSDRQFRPLCYITGPLTDEGGPFQNIGDAAELAAVAYERGWAPVVPHLYSTMDMIVGENDIDYYQIDWALLNACAVVCVLPFEINVLEDGTFSDVGNDLNLADELGIPCFTEETLPYVS